MKKGFTIIEIMLIALVVLGLTAMIFMTLNSTRAKARDSKRLTDIAQIQTALEMYSEEEGSYPVVSEPISLGKWNALRLCDADSGGIVDNGPQCALEYIKFPSEPKGGDYVFTSSAEGFDLIFKMEKPTRLGPAGTYHAHANKQIDRQAGIK